MADYRLKYTGAEVEERLDKVDKLENAQVVVSNDAPSKGALWIDMDSDEEVILAEINDVEVSNEKTWSSRKINEEFGAINDSLEQVENAIDNIQIPSLNGYATETYVQNYAQPKGNYLTQHQDISGKQNKTDDNLSTDSKDIVSAINEVNADIVEINNDINEINGDITEVNNNINKISGDVNKITNGISTANSNINKINNDINKINDNIDVFSEASGTDIVVNNSANSPFLGMKLYGKTEQPNTKGYQLFDASKLATTSAGGATVTNNGDGSFTVSGSGNLTETFRVNHTYTTEEAVKLIKVGTMKFKTEQMTYPYFLFGIYNESNDVIKMVGNVNTTLDSMIITDTDITNITNGVYNVKTYFYGTKDYPIVPGTIKPMLYQDGDGTWEEFSGGIASPNPQYPQELESVGKMGNLFNKATRNIGKRVDADGNFDTSDDLDCSDYIEVKPNTNYYLTNVCGAYYYYTGCIYDKDKKFLSKIILNENNLTILSGVINTGNNAKYLIVNTKNNVVDSCMVHEGTTALPYRPYSGQCEVESRVYGGNLSVFYKNFENRGANTYTTYQENVVIGTCATTGDNFVAVYELDAIEGEVYRISADAMKNIYWMYIYTDCLWGTVLKSYNILSTDQLTFKAPNTQKYIIGFYCGKGLDFELRNARINKGTEVLPYSPYTKQSHISLVGDGLKGIPVTDSSLATYTDEDGKMWCADYVDCDRGVLVQRVEEITIPFFDGWVKAGATTVDRYYCLFKDINGNKDFRTEITPLCTHFDRNKYGDVLYGITVNDTGFIGFAYAEPNTTTQEEFVNFIANNEVKLIFALKTPIETPLTASEIESYKALHTNSPTTTIMNNFDAYTEVKYFKNTPNGSITGQVYAENIELKSKLTALEETVNSLTTAMLMLNQE